MNFNFQIRFLLSSLVVTGLFLCSTAQAQIENGAFSNDVTGINDSAIFSSDDFAESPLLSSATLPRLSVTPSFTRRYGGKAYSVNVGYETGRFIRPLEIKGAYSHNDVEKGLDRSQYALQAKVKLYQNEKRQVYSVLGEFKRTTNTATDYKLSVLTDQPVSAKVSITANADWIKKNRVTGKDVDDIAFGLGLRWVLKPGLSLSPQYRFKNDVSTEGDWSLGARWARGESGSNKEYAYNVTVGKHSLLNLAFQKYLDF